MPASQENSLINSSLHQSLMSLPKEALAMALVSHDKGEAVSVLFQQAHLEPSLLPILDESKQDGRYSHLVKSVVRDEHADERSLVFCAHSDDWNKSVFTNLNSNTETLEVRAAYCLNEESSVYNCHWDDLASHPHLNDWLLDVLLVQTTNMEVLFNLAKNPALTDNMLKKLIAIDFSCRRSAQSSRYCQSAPSEYERDNFFKSLCKHPHLNVAMLKELLTSQPHVDSVLNVFANKALPLPTALEWVQLEGEDSLLNDEGRNAALTQIDKRLAEQEKEIPHSVNPILLKARAVFTLVEMGYNLLEIYETPKLKNALRLLIGTANKKEIALLTRSESLCITAFSSLQYLFSQQGKFDRHGYIEFLSRLNSTPSEAFRDKLTDGEAFDLDGPSLKLCQDALGLEGLIDVVTNQSPVGARDSFNALASVLYSEYPEETARQTTLVHRWLKKNERHDEFFHDYLVNKERRDNGRPPMMHFAQAQFSHLIESINKQLKQQGFDEPLSIFVPSNSHELARIGSSQRHCVGGHAYAQRCCTGRDVIFAIRVNGSLKHGFTFQFDNASQELLQAEGFCRSDVPGRYKKAAKACLKALNNNGDLPSIH